MTWIQTYTGRQFWPLEPSHDDVDLLDIAHALSMKCRYSGHAHRFYSVAEHCVLVSHMAEALCNRYAGKWGLLHDATEAYLPDVARPIKAQMPGFADIERRVMDAVCVKFDLEPAEPAIVKEIDTRILGDESAVLMPNKPEPWGDFGPLLGVTINCWSPERARAEFILRFAEVNR